MKEKRDKRYWTVYNRIRRKYPTCSKKQCGAIANKIFSK